jgi:hypothetical protein
LSLNYTEDGSGHLALKLALTRSQDHYKIWKGRFNVVFINQKIQTRVEWKTGFHENKLYAAVLMG